MALILCAPTLAGALLWAALPRDANRPTSGLAELFLSLVSLFGTTTVPLAESAVSLFGLVSGAMAIVPERQKQRWDALLLTRITSGQFVHAQLLVCLARGVILLLPLLLVVVHAHYRAYVNATLLSPIKGAEIWAMLGIFMRLLTFTLIGMSISACCRRTQSALSVCGSLVAVWAALFQVSERFTYCRADENDEHLYGQLFYWPVTPAITYWADHLHLKAAADVILGLAVPCLCYLSIRLLCRRHGAHFSRRSA